MNDDTKAVQGDALSARTTAPKSARSSLGRHAHRFDDSPISFQVTLPDGSVQRFGKAAPRFAVTLKNSQALRALANLDEGRIGEAYLAGDLDIDGDMLAPFALRGSLKDFHPGFERLRLRGLSGARDEFHLAAIVQNLKTMALRLVWPPPDLAADSVL